jgi:hypothetical protein
MEKGGSREAHEAHSRGKRSERAMQCEGRRWQESNVSKVEVDGE